MKKYIKLESETKVRMKIREATSSVKVEKVEMVFKSASSTTHDKTITKENPVAYIQNLADFTVNFITKLSRYLFSR